MTATTTTAPAFRECDANELVSQIGRMTIFSISGGRVTDHGTGIDLPVRYGYVVTVDLAADDTYTVRRTFRRAGKVTIKGEETEVYADQVGDAAYRASCYVNVPFGDHTP